MYAWVNFSGRCGVYTLGVVSSPFLKSVFKATTSRRLQHFSSTSSSGGKVINSSSNAQGVSVLPHIGERYREWLNPFEVGVSGYRQRGHDSTSPTPRTLIKKHMADSFTSFSLDFALNPNLKEEYINAHGTIRIGRLMEDLDALAGSIAYTHCQNETNPSSPLTIVTASIDRIDILREIKPDCNMQMFGFVSHVGRSSMEISIRLERIPKEATDIPQMDEISKISSFLPGQNDAPEHLLIAAKFIMVARDPVTQKAAPVNELQLDTNVERQIFARGSEHKAKKQFRSKMNLALSPPTVEEVALVHDVHKTVQTYVAHSTPLPANYVWMRDTMQTNLFMTMPQDRNIHNNIFGGHLIRLAMELSYSTAVLYLRDHPTLTALDDIEFHFPVPIGSLLSLTATVVYADPTSSHFQVSVKADVISARKGTRETTNTFYFTYKAAASSGSCRGLSSAEVTEVGDQSIPVITMVRQVLPVTYEESMMYIQGKRHKQLAMEMARIGSV